ncbi:sphingosine-1-phosphate phosphatase 2 isoform X2 [Notamacropus eugenii]|uniref:sphingosine-1-phosphate phosphatase 2 isoform X2 n=1 Tax=Notamacropus eugenii TaxID=9315 RepID=UPI003B67A324
MAELLRSLSDSHLVARFQRRCGLYPAPPEAPQEPAADSRHWAPQPASRHPLAVNGKGSGSGAFPQPYAQKCTQKYTVKNYFYHYLFKFSAALGEEIFYITFLPFTHWNIDPYVSRRLIIIWVYPFALGLMLAILFSTMVSLSRIYTGMHTVLDVIGGILISGLFIAVTYPAWDLIDHLESASLLFPICILVVPFFLCYNYPVSDNYTPTRADTTTILAAGAGGTIGFWVSPFFKLVSEPTEPAIQSIPPLTTKMLALGLTKFMVGIVVVFLVRQLMQNLSLQVLYSWFKVVTRNKEARRRLEIEVPYKFVTYSSVGICATVFVPMLHQFLGLL